MIVFPAIDLPGPDQDHAPRLLLFLAVLEGHAGSLLELLRFHGLHLQALLAACL